MRPDDALIHAMTTVATGGFSTRDGSIGFYQDPAIEWIAVMFMIVGSIPFLLYVQVLQGRFRSRSGVDQQVKDVLRLSWSGSFWQDGSMAHHSASIGLALESDAFRARSLQHSSRLLTGTGYSSTDYGLVGAAVLIAFFFIIMFVGGCAPVRRVMRHQDLPLPGVLRRAVRQIRLAQVMYPHGVFRETQFNGKPIEDPRVPLASVMSFFFLYHGFLRWSWLDRCCRLTGLDAIDRQLSGAGISDLANVGPGLGARSSGRRAIYQSLDDTVQKWLLVGFGMLLGAA
jgi:trk system potassium uptake protein TrkH